MAIMGIQRREISSSLNTLTAGMRKWSVSVSKPGSRPTSSAQLICGQALRFSQAVLW